MIKYGAGFKMCFTDRRIFINDVTRRGARGVILLNKSMRHKAYYYKQVTVFGFSRSFNTKEHGGVRQIIK